MLIRVMQLEVTNIYIYIYSLRLIFIKTISARPEISIRLFIFRYLGFLDKMKAQHVCLWSQYIF